MMLTASDFKDYLKQQFPSIINWYVGTIDKNQAQCIGIYTRGNILPNIALGGLANTSYNTLPISILVHWTDNAALCEQQANEIYSHLFGLSSFEINGRRIITTKLLDSGPKDISRDENNICEMVIRLTIFYEREE